MQVLCCINLLSLADGVARKGVERRRDETVGLSAVKPTG